MAATKQCLNCGKDFIPNKHHPNRQRFCDEFCREAFMFKHRDLKKLKVMKRKVITMPKCFSIEGVIVRFNGLDGASELEAKKYVDYVQAHKSDPAPILSIDVTACDDGKVDLDYSLQAPKFERIRRITGYLTGTLERWNDAKQAEERDRVKHAHFKEDL